MREDLNTANPPNSLCKDGVLIEKKKVCVGAISKMDILDTMSKVDLTISMHGELSVALHMWIPLCLFVYRVYVCSADPP